MWLSFDGWVWGWLREGEGKGCGRVMFWFMGLCGGDGGRGLVKI